MLAYSLFCANPHAFMLNEFEVPKKKKKRGREHVCMDV